LLLAATVGVITGVAVALFDTVVTESLEAIGDLPAAVAAFLPLAGLAAAALALHVVGAGATPSTGDEYLRAFHDPDRVLGVRALVARMLASAATLGSGCPLGLEGPSMYAGAGIGQSMQRFFPRLFSAGNRRVLLVAGAAAGVAAIFKAPATGAVFALEVPYQDDLARRMLLPALVSSASGYLVFVGIHGTEPLLEVIGAPPFSFKDLAAAVLLGAAAGLGARLFALLLRLAKRVEQRANIVLRVAAAGGTIAALVGVSRALADVDLATGVGYGTIQWALDDERALWLVAAVLVIRCVGSSATVAGGGAGGLFVPLVVAGALLGRVFGGALHETDTSLFTVIGVAAFLGAGYRVPLAAVMFVAEATGRPGFVVPGLIAAVVGELVMGNASVTRYQVAFSGSDGGRRVADEPG
jgi:CIC family chloride channel protein